VRAKAPASGTISFGVRDDAGITNTSPAAIACDDGTSSDESVIRTTLDPGTYWVAIKGRASYTGAYEVRFRDQSTLPPHADQLTCAFAAPSSSASIDASLTAGRDYYVIVKGDAPSNYGTYSLDVKDRSGITDMACANDDPSAPDAFFEFDVAAAGGHKVTVDVDKLDASMTHRWDFDGVGRTAKDMIGGYDGYVTGSGAAMSGTDLALAGTTSEQFVDLPNNVMTTNGTTPLTDATIETWVTYTGGGAWQRVFDFGDSGTEGVQSGGLGYLMMTPDTGAGAAAWYIRPSGTLVQASAGSALPTGTPTHIAVVFDKTGGFLKLYVNGTLAGQGALAGADTIAAVNMVNNWIGRSQYVSDPEFAGTIHDFRIYNRALSASDVLASFNAGADADNVAWELWKDADNDGADGDYAAGDTLVGGDCHSGAFQFSAAQMGPGKYYVKARGNATTRGMLYASVRDDDSLGAMACTDGTTGTAAKIERTSALGNRLPAGTYYVALASQNTGGSYKLTFSDGSVAGSNGAVFQSCSTSKIDYPVVAGKDYYAVVKSTGSTSGAYGLTVTDLDAIPNTTCGAASADKTAPDAYVDFDVTDGNANKQNVAIDMGGALDAVYQLIDVSGAQCVGGAGCVDSNGAACTGANCIVGCSDKGGGGANSLTAGLAAGHYRVKVKGKSSAAGAGNATFDVSMRDVDGVGALECDNGTTAAGDQAVLDLSGAKRLAAGTYRVGISGQAGAVGAYKLLFRKPGTNPAGATQVACATDRVQSAVVAGRPYYVIVKGGTTGTSGTYGVTVTDVGAVNNTDLAACGADPSAPDAFFEFDVTDSGADNQNVEIDLKNSSALNGAFQLYRDVGTNNVIGDDVAVGTCKSTSDPAASYALPAGRYYVKVKGKSVLGGAGQQPFTITLRDTDSIGARACGTTVGGAQATLTQTLTPGTYRAGITGKSGSAPTSGAYRLSVRDSSGGALIGASRIGCSQNGYVDVALQSGKEYYAIVKGVVAASSGTYTLSMSDLSAVTTTMGCGADNSAPDEYFYFNVDDAAGRTVTLDMNSSMLSGAYELFKSDGTSLGCGTSSSSRSFTLPKAANYYVAVKGTNTAAGNAEKPFELSIKDNAVSQAIACGFSNAAGASVIDQTLDAGTYYVAVTGNSNTGGPTSGTYRVTFEDKNVTGTGAAYLGCSTTELEQDVTAGTPYYVVVKGTPGGNPAYTLHVDDVGAVTDMVCNGVAASDSAPDAYAAFSVGGGTNKDVTVDMSGSTLDSVFELWKDNGASDTKIGCATSAGAASQITSNLAPGNYYLKARSTSAYNGAGMQPLQFSFRDDDVQRATDCNNGAITSGTTITKNLTAGQYYVGVRPQAGQSPGVYRVTVRDTALNSVGGPQVACTTGNTTDVNVTANKDYYVLVKGETAASKGTFGLTVTDIGALDPNTGSFYDTRTDIGCGADLSAADAFYEFTVAGASPTKNVEVSITNGFNGAYQLYRDDGGFTADDAVSTCQTAAHSYALANGKYFVVVKGRAVASGAAEQPLQVSIRDLSAIGSLACADGDSGTPATIRTTDLPASALDAQGRLLAGTYYVALSGQSGQDGPYELMFFDQDQIGGSSATVDQCTTAQSMTATLKPSTDYYVVVKGNGPPNQGPFTLTMTDVSNVQPIDASCPTDLSAADGYAAFQLTNARKVRIDMSGSALTGAFQVFTGAGAAVTGCGCSSIASPLTCSLPAGSYYVVYRGDNVANGLSQKPFQLVMQDLDALGSIECADGAIATGNTITTPLAAGTYYLGIIPSAGNTSTDFSYKLNIKDQASTVVNGAPQIACSATQIDANVNAGQPYYVVVKGKDAGDQGPYGLTIQDLSGVPSFGCGDDTTKGDAFYSFDVTNPAGSNVTIDSEGSTLQTVLALFPAAANVAKDWKNNTSDACCNPGTPATNCLTVASCDGKPDDMIACDSSSGVMGTSKIDNVHLGPGTYYVVVRARLGAPDANKPFNISVRDNGSLVATSCDPVDPAHNQARIRQTLQPGTYYVALNDAPTATGARNYKLRFRDYAPFANSATQVACNTTSDTINYTVPPDHVGKPYYVVVKGDTAAEQAPYKLTVENLQLATGMGCNADNLAPDAFYRFSLNAQTAVSIDTVGSVLDTVAAIYPASAAYFGTNYAEDASGSVVNCNDNGGGGTASKIQATLNAGDYYLVVKGAVGSGSAYGMTSKPFEVSIRDQVTDAAIECAPATSPKITRTLPAGDYKLVVSDDGAGGSYDVKFKDKSVEANAATSVQCNDAQDTIDATLAANTPYYVVVKGKGTGASSKGAYSLTVENSDTHGTTMGCGAAATSPDAFFKFSIQHQSEVTLDTVGSVLDTVLAIYPGNATVFGTNYANDAFGDQIDCNNDAVGLGTASKISATLAAGDYYAVVKGATAGYGASNQKFNLSIRDDGVTRAITCANAGSGSKIEQELDAGSYVVVLSDTNASGTAGAGGAYSMTFKDLNAAAQAGGSQVSCGVNKIDGGDANGDGKPDGVQVDAGQDYYVVVKGNGAGDAGNYTMTVEDVVSSQAAAGSTPIACAAEGSAINATYPAGDYYAVVSGPSNTNGAFELKVEDVDPFADYNRIACDADSGPNGTSVIEADLQPGAHYVVVKGDGPGQSGTYQLNVRDMDAREDHRLACTEVSHDEKLTYRVKANQDYTVLLKGDESLAQGDYNIKLYDELGLQSSSGSMLKCQTMCPDIAPYNSTGSSSFCCKSAGNSCSKATDCCSGVCGSNKKCSAGVPSFEQSLAPDTYYLTVKGRKAAEKGYFELQVGDPNNGASVSKYVPPVWTEVKDALAQSGVKVLPVLSCAAGSNDGRCNGAEAQAKNIAQITGVMTDATSGQGLIKRIKDDGTGMGAGLAMAIRDLSNYLAMDISLSVVDNPGFQIDIQKCTNSSDPVQQAVCSNFTTGCNDTSPTPKNRIAACNPGAQPKFFVNFKNPLDPNAVPPNPSDPNGGYHFKLLIVGNQQYTLEEIPVYIIPTDKSVMAPPPPGAGTYQTSGTYEQQVFGSGCNYYKLEGEGAGKAEDSCSDGIDNNMDGTIDDADPGCQPGSCLDGINNDKDMSGGSPLLDLKDPDCSTTVAQDWTDLFFKADIPQGTSILFDMCTAGSAADLASCSYSRVATVVSAGACSTSSDCKNVNVGGVMRDGFCSTSGGQCQFITPPKLSVACSSNADCAVLNGPYNGETISTFCNMTKHQCENTTPPAEIGNNLMQGQNGKPFAKLKVTLKADANASATPTLYEWYMQYVCRPLN
jgi:hypothetical protein